MGCYNFAQLGFCCYAVFFWHCIFVAWEIERRPRGASRVYALTLSAPVRSSAARAALRGTSPLPHLLQRGHACGRGVVRLGVLFEAGEVAVAPAGKPRQGNKADNHGLSGSARCNKCGSGLVPRSAARAALDLTGNKNASTNTYNQRPTASNPWHARLEGPCRRRLTKKYAA